MRPGLSDCSCSPTSLPPRVAILGHVGKANLGDEAIIASVIQNIRDRIPQAEIFGITLDPEDTHARHGIRSFPLRRASAAKQVISENISDASGNTGESSRPESFSLRQVVRRIPGLYSLLRQLAALARLLAGIVREIRFLKDSYKRLQGTDLLIIAGSHQLNDYVAGAWSFPYTLFKWSLLAKATRTASVFLSVGAGPIDTAAGRLLSKWALKLARYRSLRDEDSLSLINQLHVGPSHFVPDLVFSWRLPAEGCPGENDRRIVGINPLPFFDQNYWHASHEDRYSSYVAMLAGITDFLVDQGFDVWLFPTQLRVDPAVIADITARVKPATMPHLIRKSVNSFDDLTAGIASCDMVVATRYHGILLSLLFEKPVLALAYHGKSHALMHLLGQSAYSLDADSMELPAIEHTLLRLAQHSLDISAELHNRLPTLKQALSEQYDIVLAPLKC